MEIEAVAQLIRAGLPDAQVQVTGDGSHFEALVVSAAFLGKGPLERQRLVMATVRPQLESGELHALSIKARIPASETDQTGSGLSGA
ncbi:MAG: BolA/IbaG family iron-sulfur metabolism protein [Chromatiaceae bacterium]|nr:BolA/IbaG family iron-sulfur metabolism protein [Chromatiaceae bacterium]